MTDEEAQGYIDQLRAGKQKGEATLAAPSGSAYTLESAKVTLEEVYQWLHDGPMGDWDKRCSLHRRIGDMLGKKRVEYHE